MKNAVIRQWPGQYQAKGKEHGGQAIIHSIAGKRQSTKVSPRHVFKVKV